MNMNYIYYIFLSITVITYLIGLFLSQFEKKEKMSSLSTGNAGYVKTFEMEPGCKKKEDEEII